MTKLILASQSGSRRAMLADAGVDHESLSADVNEAQIKQELANHVPAKIATELASAKALWVSSRKSGHYVLGGDSMVSVQGRLYSKPNSREEAAEHLRRFSGQMMTLWSAAAFALDGTIIDSVCEEARLHIRPLSEGFITSYLDDEWPALAHCVGCFRIESRGVQLFESVEGSHFTILGMPLLWVLGALRQYGLISA